MTIAAIDERRRLAGISQKDVCRRAGVHPTTYSLIKNGRRDCYATTLEKLAAAVSALIEEKERAA